MLDADGFVKNPKPLQNFKESLAYPFVEGVSKLLPKWKPDFLVKHRIVQENKIYERAARGAYEYGTDFVKKVEGKNILADCEEELCRSSCRAIEDGFYKKFSENLVADSPKYGTVFERTGVRLLSTIIPAIFLANDFRNKAIRDGATQVEADKEANKKRKQEIISGVGEAYAQFALLGGFPVFVNNSAIDAPLINTGIGLFFNIFSRLIQGMSLTKIDIKDKAVTANTKAPSSMQEFLTLTKKVDPQKTFKGAEQNPKQAKKEPLLSLKNIGLFCLLSVTSGMALKFGGRGFSKTSVGKFFKKYIDSFKEWFNNKTMKELFVGEDDLKPFYEALGKTGNKRAFSYYDGILKKAFKAGAKDGKISLGKVEKNS